MEDMSALINSPRYVYADILIALAEADNQIVDEEKEFLDTIFEDMGLDSEVLAKMWVTPRSLDVIESLLADIENVKYKSSLLKDCYLLAYADSYFSPEESRFIQHVKAALNLGKETEDKIKDWVERSIALHEEGLALF